MCFLKTVEEIGIDKTSFYHNWLRKLEFITTYLAKPLDFQFENVGEGPAYISS